MPKRHITFLTGTRAEFGLMEPTLRAIRSHPKLHLSLLATGMHLDPAHGNSIEEIQRRGFKIDATIPWPSSSFNVERSTLNVQRSKNPSLAIHTGNAIAAIAPALAKLRTDILLVVGDRVEAFAGAAAAHLSHLPVAHVHGGDRALGQLDDSLRHAITKLSHLHFPATAQSAKRILKLGEDPKTVFPVGSPGLDGITKLATPIHHLRIKYNLPKHDSFALLLLHPASPDQDLEERRAHLVLDATLKRFPRTLIVYPNNDPGSPGILRAWKQHATSHTPHATFHPDLPRPDFLGLLRDAAVLVGNSSSGIIEAASLQTPVLDIGPRQLGRERSNNVAHCDYSQRAILHHLDPKKLRATRSRRVENVYGNGTAARSICRVLATHALPKGAFGKLITY